MIGFGAMGLGVLQEICEERWQNLSRFMIAQGLTAVQRLDPRKECFPFSFYKQVNIVMYVCDWMGYKDTVACWGSINCIFQNEMNFLFITSGLGSKVYAALKVLSVRSYLIITEISKYISRRLQISSGSCDMSSWSEWHHTYTKSHRLHGHPQ